MSDEPYIDVAITTKVATDLGFGDIEPRIHKDDFIFLYHLDDGHNKRTLEQATTIYLSDGAASTEKLKRLLSEYLPGKSTIKLLEFASGYGCLTRHLLKDSFIQTTACDIHPEAVDFIRSVLGESARLSTREPEHLALGETYDAVFALSFFSHMPPGTFKPWLNVLLDHVKDQGVLIFTTLGRIAQGKIDLGTLGPSGCWFAPLSEQRDLPTSDYGTMLVTPHFVFDAISHRSDYVLKFFSEGFWWNNQDIFIFQKIENGAEKGLHPANANTVAREVENARLALDAENSIEALKSALEIVRQSTSWKVTRPLRAIKNLFISNSTQSKDPA